MKNFTNPLERVRIASPCSADWNEMQGDARKRFCAECKLNVYNLSAMTRKDAETLLVNSEGRLCVRFYRRADGTILTRNCPVGWARIKQRVSRFAAAMFSLVMGFFSGLWSFNLVENFNGDSFKKAFVEAVEDKSENIEKTPYHAEQLIPVAGKPEFEMGEIPLDVSLYTTGQKRTGLSKGNKKTKAENWSVGRVENVRPLEDEPVEVWIK